MYLLATVCFACSAGNLTWHMQATYAKFEASFYEVYKCKLAAEKTKGRLLLMSVQDRTPISINFHFDPQCPLAWRTALWVREVRNVRPVTITWRLFSLEIVNRKEGVEPDYINGRAWAALRTLALARRQKGNEAIEKLYIALGNAAHGRKESISQREVVEAAAQEAGLGTGFVEEALNDES